MLQIWGWRTSKMCFYCILKELFCIGEGTKSWGYGREQAILNGHFLEYMCWLVFSEKTQLIEALGFFLFCRTMDGLLVKTNPRTNISPFSLLRSCKYGWFRSLFNVMNKVWSTLQNQSIFWTRQSRLVLQCTNPIEFSSVRCAC